MDPVLCLHALKSRPYLKFGPESRRFQDCMNSVPLLHELKKQDFLDSTCESRRFEKRVKSDLPLRDFTNQATLVLPSRDFTNELEVYPEFGFILVRTVNDLDHQILWINEYCLKSASIT